MPSGSIKQTVGRSIELEHKPAVSRPPVAGMGRCVKMIHCQEESSARVGRVLSMIFFSYMH